MKKCFVVIDYQYDFVAGDGKLTCGKPAQDIENNIIHKLEQYTQEDYDIYFTLDSHLENDWAEKSHPEGRLFPLHCQTGTKGAELCGKVKELFDKNQYTAISKNSFMLPFDKINEIVSNNYDEIEFAGVASNICVLQNAIGFYNVIAHREMNVKLSVDACCVASFDHEAHTWALKYMQNNLGFQIYNVES